MIRIPLVRSSRSAARSGAAHCRAWQRPAGRSHRPRAAPRPDAPMQISWEVRNRFRLFREERDFLLHTDSARGRSILASEQALELQSDGRGWARNMVNRLCIDLTGRVSEPCTRDNVKESYLTPTDHPVTVRLTGAGSGRRHLRLVVRRWRRSAAIDARLRRAGQFAGALRPHHRGHRRCLQRTRGAAAPRRPRSRCATSSSPASATASPPAKAIRTGRSRCRTTASASAPISAAASAQYYRPSRAGYQGRPRLRSAGHRCRYWQRQSALWFNSACHRSLYSYQTRTALALAVQYPHIAVTYLPLACTGATIADGLFGSQRARECLPTKSGRHLPGHRQRATRRIARRASRPRRRRQPDRKLDLVLLSIGANDINFSGLVADVIVDTADRARAVPAQRRDRIGGRFTRRAGARPAAGLRQTARGAEAAGRRPVACRLCVLCQSDAGGRRRALPRRPRRLRYPSLLQRRPAAARQRVELCAERIPAAAEGDRAVPVRRAVPRSRPPIA